MNVNIFPRGFTRQLIIISRKAGVHPIINDQTRELRPVCFKFKGQPRPFQQKAVADKRIFEMMRNGAQALDRLVGIERVAYNLNEVGTREERVRS